MGGETNWSAGSNFARVWSFVVFFLHGSRRVGYATHMGKSPRSSTSARSFPPLTRPDPPIPELRRPTCPPSLSAECFGRLRIGERRVLRGQSVQTETGERSPACGLTGAWPQRYTARAVGSEPFCDRFWRLCSDSARGMRRR